MFFTFPKYVFAEKYTFNLHLIKLSIENLEIGNKNKKNYCFKY